MYKKDICFTIIYSFFSFLSYPYHPKFVQNNIEFEGLDIAGDLEELKKNIAKMKKGKYGAGLSDMDMNDLDWMDQNAKRVKAVTILIYETSV